MKRTTRYSIKIRKALKVLGPGLVTGASDDDPSGIATYTQTGAQFGYATLWTALLTFPLMAAVQGMCARIGMVTTQGLTVTLRKHYSKPVLYLMLLFSFPAITLNIGADIQGMGAVANMLVPQIPTGAFSTAFAAILMFIIIRFPYQKISAILKWLCLSLLLYIAVVFMIEQDWKQIAINTFIPTIRFDKDFLSILVAVLGATISPYLFFWQATMEAEDIKHGRKKIEVDKHLLKTMRKDVNIGMFLSNVVMFFIILTAGSVLFKEGIHKIDTVDQAARALEPLVGEFAYLFFALGVIGTGFLGIPVLAGSQAYMLAETFEWDAGLDKEFPQAKPFYISIIISIVAGLGVNFISISPIRLLVYSAILYGLTAPVLIGMIMHIGNNKKIMGDMTNSTLSNVLGGATLLLMSAAAIGLLYFQLMT